MTRNASFTAKDSLCFLVAGGQDIAVTSRMFATFPVPRLLAISLPFLSLPVASLFPPELCRTAWQHEPQVLSVKDLSDFEDLLG